MLRKLLSKSGRRLLRAIKKLSTRSRRAKNSQLISRLSQAPEADVEVEAASFSWSLPSLDAKSIDTYMTYVGEPMIEDCEDSSCCCCDEYEQNQRNENRENEMII